MSIKYNGGYIPAVGADGTTLVADSSTSTGLRYNPITGNQNFLINGGQDIWQRGTSFTGTGWAFTSDRWAFLSLGGNSTVTQETSVVPVGFKYFAKFTANATVTGYLSQSIETLNTLQLAGKTVAFSAQVAASTSIPLQLVVEYSTTVDATSGASWTGITATSGSTATPTSTTFISISGIFAIPSNAQTIRAYVKTQNTITSGQTFYFGASKLEIGNVPTAYTKAGGTLQGELAACQRYFAKSYPQGTAPQTNSTTNGLIAFPSVLAVNGGIWTTVKLPSTMRTTPTVTIYSYAGSVAGSISQESSGSDFSSNSGLATQIGDSSFAAYNGSGASITPTNGGMFHYVATAEL
jgi:hypothetical protein